jgi:hypothetical protein
LVYSEGEVCKEETQHATNDSQTQNLKCEENTKDSEENTKDSTKKSTKEQEYNINMRSNTTAFSKIKKRFFFILKNVKTKKWDHAYRNGNLGF